MLPTVIMDCGNKPKRRRRMESQTSSASNQTQVTQLSFESTTPPEPSPIQVKSINSQSDMRKYQSQTRRKRTLSERPYSFAEDGRDIDFATNSGDTEFYLESPTTPDGQSHLHGQPRFDRRNTEHSINTQVMHRTPSLNADDFHRCNTTSCIQGRAMQQSCGVSQTRQMMFQRQPYDNNCFSCNPQPLTPAHRSRSASAFEHHYVSLEPSDNSYIRPVPTSVVLQGNGHTQVVPNARVRLRGSSDMLDTPDNNTPRSDTSSGYCKSTNLLNQNMCGCLSDKTVNFYKNGFFILILVNILVLLICVVGLPVAYFFATQAEPESSGQHCLDDSEAQTILRGTYKHALVKHPKSGKYCVNNSEMLKQVSSVSIKEPCRPALQLEGSFGSGNSRVKWDGRDSCGFKISADNTSIEVNHDGWYFIFSRIHFYIDNTGKNQQFPVGHKLYKNLDSIDEVRQTCSAGNGLMKHTSILESIHFLNKGNKIWVEIEAESSRFANVSKHKLGLFLL